MTPTVEMSPPTGAPHAARTRSGAVEEAATTGAPVAVVAVPTRAAHRSSLGRAVQIAEVLAHYELWTLTVALDLERFVPRHRTAPDRTAEPAEPLPAERLRLAIEELGPTFMKLGQMLSTRADLLPPAYQVELGKLQDDASTLSVAEVRATISAELGQPPEQVFATFETTPLAAASIGQAHAATLHDGTAVVVKVRRPGAVEQIDEDLRLLHHLARVAADHWAAASAYDVVGLMQEFDHTLRAELDYLHEGHNAERFRQNFAADPTVEIPRVFWEATTTRVLTLARLDGLKVTDVAALDAAGIDRVALARAGARLVLKMIFEDDFFHADLHPGNLFIEDGGRIGLIDFGMVGTVDDQTRTALARLVLAVIAQNADGVVDAVLEMGASHQPVDRRALSRDVAVLLAPPQDQPSGTIAVGPLLMGVQSVLRRYHLVLPGTLALVLKTVAMSESLGEGLDPAFHFLDVFPPYAQRLLLQENAPGVWLKRLEKEVPDLAWLATEMPHHVRRLVGDLEEGRLTLMIQPTGLDGLVRSCERSVARLVLSILVAAVLVALAILTAASHPAGWAHVPVTVLAIGTAGAALGLVLAWSAIRSVRAQG